MDYPALVCTSLGDPGGSAYYRVVLPVFQANQRGYIQLRMPKKMQFYPQEMIKAMKPDTVLFHKSHTQDHRNYMNDISNLGNIQLVYTIDDWMSKIPKESPHYEGAKRDADKEIKKAVSICDKLIVTTKTLANVYGWGKDVYIIPNYLSELVWKQIYSAAGPRKPRNDGKIRIGWSGGIGHPGDLQILREVADLLGDDYQWVFLGGAPPPGFDQGNSEMHSPVPPPQYSGTLYDLDLDLALAPLLDNDFNKAKSNLRVLEYAACGYPIIASNVLAYSDCPVHLLDYKASWWAEKIKTLCEDRDQLRQEGEKLKAWVWENYKLEDHLMEYANILSPDGHAFTPEKLDVVGDTVDIIITTHNSKEFVKKCVNSVLDSLPDIQSKVEVIVTDNNSDEAGMQDYLKSLEEAGITVLYSDKDYGYIHNVNKGLKLHNNRDVVVLNSDTIVRGDWVDRLQKIAYSEDRVATVTPWTNNGTIVSYPDPSGSALEPALVRLYDGVASGMHYDVNVELPTPVGFCMYMKRAALADLGLFDEHGYGRGYGDENDWSLRSQIRVWKNILGYNVYVGHAGSASFGVERKQLMLSAGAALTARHSHYGEMIQKWMQMNPLTSLRQRMDISAIDKTTSGDRSLYIAHGYGGGLETYVQSRLDKDLGAVVLRNDPQQPGIAMLSIQGEKYHNLPNINIKLTSMEFVKEMFQKMNVARIHVQTTFGYDYNFPTWLMNLSKVMKLPYDLMLHDYWSVCPRLRLVQNTEYCGEPAVEECNQCVIDNGSGVGQVNVDDWRKMYAKLLQGADKVYSPSHDLANRIEKYFGINIQVIPHENDIKIGQIQGASVKWPSNKELRVAVIGNISPDKGSLVVRDCARYCEENGFPVKFIVFGSLIDNSSVLKMIDRVPNISVTGNYEEQDIRTMLKLNPCHLSAFFNLWPETYSYTLSHALRAGLWPVAFDIGAIAERIREFKFGHIIPWEKRHDIKFIVDTILEQAKIRSI